MKSIQIIKDLILYTEKALEELEQTVKQERLKFGSAAVGLIRNGLKLFKEAMEFAETEK